MQASWRYPLAVMLTVASLVVSSTGVGAEEFANSFFRRVWQRTDYPVQTGQADHSWIWGPEPFTTGLMEVYLESPDKRREIQYFDKSRMELNDPSADQSNPWFVTNGLLVNEMISGQVQIGEDNFIPLPAANVPVAGDPDNTFPTYASLIRLFRTPAGRQVGDHVTSVFLPEGAGEFSHYANNPATEIVRLEQGFGIPRVFDDFMQRTGDVFEDGRIVGNQRLIDPVYVIGLPTTDAFWTKVRVDGVEQEVMFQAFERRLLTYTPSNPEPFQVEMGNVGRHYYQWRYVAPFAGGAQAIITQPAATAGPPRVGSPLVVQGFESGAAFEAAVSVRLKNAASDALIADQSAVVMRPDVAIPGPFSVTLTFEEPAADTPAVLEVYTTRPSDGSIVVLARMEVVVKARS